MARAAAAEAAGAAPEVLRGRVVDAATNRPLENVQVFVPELDAGILSRADGSFALDLRGLLLDSLARDLTVEAQRIGYGPATRRLDLTGGDTEALEFALEATAISVDGFVITGAREVRKAAERTGAVAAAVEEADPTGAGLAPAAVDFPASSAWLPVDGGVGSGGDDAAVPTLPGLEIVAVRRASVSGADVIRVDQLLEDGTPIALFVAGLPLSIQNRAEDANVAQRQVGDRWVAAVAALDESLLHERLERIR